MKNFVLFLAISLLFYSCEEMPKNTLEVNENVESVSSVDSNIINETNSEKLLKTENISFVDSCLFGDILINIEEKNNKLFITSNSKMVEDFVYELEGEIQSFIVTDVNADGYNEFYCITNHGDILAFASYRNKSFGEIYIPEKPKNFYKDLNEIKFWEVKNNHLLLTFSNGKEQKLNQVRYSLLEGETSFRLEAQ